MPGLHATLSPSAASRWLSCPASVRVAKDIPQGPDSPYAREGTLAHALAEIEAAFFFGLTSMQERDLAYEAWRASAGLDIDTIGDMAAHVNTYIALIQERLAIEPMSQLLLEQRMDTGVADGACWGTSDTVIVSPSHVEIIDLKYGMGLPVSAEGNPQLRLYGLGALDTFGDVLGETEYIRMTISQPRLNSVTSETLQVAELRAWRDSIQPIADQALNDPDAPFGPSETACRWCPAAGECRARVEKLAGDDFGPPESAETLDAEELAELLKRVPEMRKFFDAVEAAGLRRAYSQQEHIPGFKVVRSGGRRFFTDADGAIRVLKDEGLVEDQFLTPRKLKGLGDLTKLVNGSKRFTELLGPYVGKSEGSVSLVPEDDRRTSIDPNGEAVSEFTAAD